MKMLVCLDGSPRQAGVLGAAIALGRKNGGKLVLFRSVGLPQEVPPEALSMRPEEVPRLLEERALADLRTLEKEVPSALAPHVLVKIGTPWRSIEQAAAEENADLIVIGSHGYSGLDRVLGTTAERVVNHADRAVLVVRAPERLQR